MIEVKGLTIQYLGGRGVFDLDFSVKQGEVMGYLGPNGAGKTTTIRALMGFMKPDKGSSSIDGLDCFGKSAQIKKRMGYIPGETAFPDGMSGEEYLKLISDMRGTRDLSLQKLLLKQFELSPKGSIRKFSKGMKQKLAIITAFMHNPDVLVLDEPSSGLDPLMQSRFVDLILSEKSRGKTILLSSHMFEEVEKTCDNVLIIKEGRIIRHSNTTSLKASQRKAFALRIIDPDVVLNSLIDTGFDAQKTSMDTIDVFVAGDAVDKFVKTLSEFTVLSIESKPQTLEDIFMDYYRKETIR